MTRLNSWTSSGIALCGFATYHYFKEEMVSRTHVVMSEADVARNICVNFGVSSFG